MAKYKFSVGEEVICGRANDVVILEHLDRAADGMPRYFVQDEDGSCRDVREDRLEREPPFGGGRGADAYARD